jgi:hypothetical protein
MLFISPMVPRPPAATLPVAVALASFLLSPARRIDHGDTIRPTGFFRQSVDISLATPVQPDAL